MNCECGKGLVGTQKRWCSRVCKQRDWNARANNGVGRGHGQITEAKLAEVKARYPSCARLWDVEMVDKAWPRLSWLFPRRLERLNRADSQVAAGGFRSD